MEGVGARLGRSSTRYGPATIFTGPVRKWKKKWVHVASSSSSGTASNANGNAAHSLHNGASAAVNGTNGSHLLLFKWTPTTLSQNSAAGNGNGDAKAFAASKDDAASEEPTRRKFKYVPIAVLEEQKYDATDDEVLDKESDVAKAVDADASSSGKDEKPDINDVPMDENEDTNKVVCQDLNESTLDLSLGFNGNDEPDSNDSDHRES